MVISEFIEKLQAIKNCEDDPLVKELQKHIPKEEEIIEDIVPDAGIYPEDDSIRSINIISTKYENHKKTFKANL